MMIQTTYIKQFLDYDSAFTFMQMKNRVSKKETFCVVPGCEGDDYAVVDHWTAVELGLGYVISSRGWVANPFVSELPNH